MSDKNIDMLQLNIKSALILAREIVNSMKKNKRKTLKNKKNKNKKSRTLKKKKSLH